MAMVAAESPSVKMSVHWPDFGPPAHAASSSLTIPRTVLLFLPSVFLSVLSSAMAERSMMRCSMPDLKSLVTKAALTSGLDPNLAAAVVSVSLVWLSNVGLEMVHLMNKNILSLMVWGLMLASLCFFVRSSVIFFTIWPRM